MSSPELSIIIPTLNEALTLPQLLADLRLQQGVDFEVIVSDGGSADGTAAQAEQLLAAGGLSGEVIVGPVGRGRQLNLAASRANGSWLLFLHADSRLHGSDALRLALGALREPGRRDGDLGAAGRFRLRFAVNDDEYGFGYRFYEAKAALGRPGCIHGDQGFLLSRALFAAAGPYREDLPVMEDSSLAERVRQVSRWQLLPVEIWTSPRRFRSEGLRQRQTLNALLMNFQAIGWDVFLQTAPDLYRQQSRAGQLELPPFFHEIRRRLAALPAAQRRRIWLATGAYVRSQAWQLVFARGLRKGGAAAASEQRLAQALERFERWFDPLTDHALGHLLTAGLVMAWFRWQCRRSH